MERERALEIVKKHYSPDGVDDTLRRALETLIPELTESEDERIRKDIVSHFESIKAQALYDKQEESDSIVSSCNEKIVYLEKQKEQKPTEWSKNDTVFLNEITDFFENKTVRLQHDIDMYAHWLKSLPERLVLQPKAEWSEEDEHRRKDAIYFLESAKRHYADTSEIEKTIDFLSSLRPQPRKEIYQAARHNLALRFMNYLDENRPEGKMSLSNAECEDIDKAFKENDWATILRYAEKYSPSWKPSEVCYGPKGDPDPAGVQTEKDVEKYPEDKSFEDEWKEYYNNSLISRLPMNKREVAKHFYWFAKKNAWKPSEEQMDAFRSYIKDFQEKAEAAVGGWNNFDVMIRLFEQLKKL